MIRLLVHGLPAPQGSKTAVRRGNFAKVIEGSSDVGRAKHQAWRSAVTAAAVEQRTDIDKRDPVGVTIHFWMPKPQSKPKGVWLVRVKPDLDKLVRATLDGLADGGLLPGGDGAVSFISAHKEYAPPGSPTGAQILVDRLDEPVDGRPMPRS